MFRSSSLRFYLTRSCQLNCTACWETSCIKHLLFSFGERNTRVLKFVAKTKEKKLKTTTEFQLKHFRFNYNRFDGWYRRIWIVKLSCEKGRKSVFFLRKKSVFRVFFYLKVFGFTVYKNWVYRFSSGTFFVYFFFRT